MDIIKYTKRLDVNKLTKNDISKIDSIAIHHMKHKTADLDTVTSWHIDENLWAWCGYGYWISKNGEIYECRGYTYQNAGVLAHNDHAVSIGFQGDYDIETQMPNAQYDAGVALIKYLKEKLPNIRFTDGHKKWVSTDCPGKYFPLLNMIQDTSIDQNFIDNIDYLVSYGQLNSPDFWKQRDKTKLVVPFEYVKIIINNFAEWIKNKSM